MFNYDVLINSRRVKEKFLTYRSAERLVNGQVVLVPLKKQAVLGLVVSKSRANIPLEKLRSVLLAEIGELPAALTSAVNRLAVKDNFEARDLAQLLLSNAKKPLKRPFGGNYLVGQDQPGPKLNDDQKKVLKAIRNNLVGRPQLLRGVTGSGKTQVYLELAKEVLAVNRSVLLLSPQIGLSQQLFDQALEQLNRPIYHFHSQLKKSQRGNIWLEIIKKQDSLVVVGPRSASLLPIKNLGLIVMDECHDEAYKQDRPEPTYQTLHLVSQLAKAHRAKLLLASASPKVDDYYHFKRAGYPIHQLTSKAKKHSPAKVRIISRPIKNNKLLCSASLRAIEKAVRNNHQALILHNRRGSYRLIICWQCFWRASCPTCQKHLVFHQEEFQLVCHRCQQKTKPISVCPKCQTPLSFGQPGDKALVEEVKQASQGWPNSGQIVRFDQDNLPDETLVKKIKKIRTLGGQIIVGTKVINKGFNLPKLETVIVVDAESDLVSPDYRVLEKMFQSISHLLGRIGRGYLEETNALIQSRNPKNPLLSLASQENWLAFYEQEIARRQKAKLPPFVFAANIYLKQGVRQSLEKANSLREKLAQENPGLHFFTPLPVVARFNNRPSWLINVFGSKRSSLAKLRPKVNQVGGRLDLEPPHLFE